MLREDQTARKNKKNMRQEGKTTSKITNFMLREERNDKITKYSLRTNDMTKCHKIRCEKITRTTQ